MGEFITKLGSRRAFALGLAAFLVAGCGGAPEKTPTPAEPPAESASKRPPEQPAGHRQMVELLERVRQESLRDNPFTGRNQPDEVRAKLAELPQGVPDLRRWLFLRILSQHELRLGENEAGLEHALAAYRELDVFKDQIPEEEALATILEAGVAHMRQAEASNCVHHHTSESCLLPIEGGGVHVEQGPAREAIRYFTEVADRTPHDSWWNLKGRWLLNIAAMTVGEYPQGVPPTHLIPPGVFDSEEPFPRFPEISAEVGFTNRGYAGGVVADDLDGDGFLDTLISSSDPGDPLFLYWNRGDGTFAEGASAAGLDGILGGLNMVQADYDNDGDIDVYVMRGAWWRDFGRHPDSLLRNNGDRTFTDVTFPAGLGQVHYPTEVAGWADYDLDGDVDLYVGNDWQPEIDAPGQLFQNGGDGTFTDVAVQAGVANRGFAKGVTWGDYDNDRYPDLFVSNLSGRDMLYHNQGDGTFVEVAEKAGVESPHTSFGCWFWDFDNDGALDLLVLAYGGRNVGADNGFIAASYLGLPSQAERTHLYRGDGKGGFTEVGLEQGLDEITHPMGANFGDLDNDGYPDFYLGTGYVNYESLMPNVLYHNLRGKGFADVTTAARVGHLQKGHGIAFADLDNDGDQDLFEQMGGMYPGDPFLNVLFHNPGFGQHWIKVRLVGTKSNRAGMGARIRVVVQENGQRREIHKLASSGGTFGANPLWRQEIGLGQAERIDELEVSWPASDTKQTFRGVAADQAIEITEGEATFRPLPLVPLRFGEGAP